MRVYTNGCSHTQGTKDAFEDDYTTTWPNRLAAHYQASLVNQSKRGCSNDRIFRKTLEYITSCEQIPDLIAIQWTHPERIELNVGDSIVRNHACLNPSSFVSKHKDKSFQLKDFVAGLSDRLDDSWKKISSEQIVHSSTSITHKLLNYMHVLEVMFNHYRVPRYKFIVWTGVDTTYKTYDAIDKTKIIFNAHYLLTEKGYERNPIDNHYGPDAHNEIFRWVVDEKFYHTNLPAPDDPEIYDYTNDITL